MKIGFLIDLTQDTEFVVPLALECKNRSLNYVIYVSRVARHNNKSLITKLKRLKLKLNLERVPKKIRDKYFPVIRWPSLIGLSSFVTAVETNMGPHRLSHSTVQRAKKRGVRTYTLQHGFENIGLTYSDAEYPIKKVQIESDTIFIWPELQKLHPNIRAETRNKCVPIGIAKNYTELEPTQQNSKKLAESQFIVGIFENLHWRRFDEAYRNEFFRLLRELPKRFPELSFRLKSHPAGQWFTKQSDSLNFSAPNFEIIDPVRFLLSGKINNEFIAECDCIITTPSTVAIDGVVCKKPVIVLGFNLPIDNYKPLPVASTIEEVVAFLEETKKDSSRYLQSNLTFLQNQIVSCDAKKAIIDYIAREAAV